MMVLTTLGAVTMEKREISISDVNKEKSTWSLLLHMTLVQTCFSHPKNYMTLNNF